jgi:hypothetical protein
LIGLDSLFQKTAVFTPKKRTVKPEDAFENTAFEQWFENVKGLISTYLRNRYH